MAYPYLIQGKNIVVVIGSVSHTISSTHIAYERVKAAIKSDDWETVEGIIDPKQIVIEYGNGDIAIEGEKFFWKGQELHTSLTVRIIQMYQDGFPIEPMVNFMENLMLNPSKRAVTELYGFLEKGNLPITPDGHFLAYKKVKQDYTDCYTGAIDNSVGQVVEMERNSVDDDQNRTCSTGLHFCSREYLNHFGGERVMILKINPRDVVSIPNDYNDTKGRACRYEVIDEIDKEKADEAFAKSVQATAEREASVLTQDDLIKIAQMLKAVAAANTDNA
jgi:hypothetical protein